MAGLTAAAPGCASAARRRSAAVRGAGRSWGAAGPRCGRWSTAGCSGRCGARRPAGRRRPRPPARSPGPGPHRRQGDACDPCDERPTPWRRRSRSPRRHAATPPRSGPSPGARPRRTPPAPGGRRLPRGDRPRAPGRAGRAWWRSPPYAARARPRSTTGGTGGADPPRSEPVLPAAAKSPRKCATEPSATKARCPAARPAQGRPPRTPHGQRERPVEVAQQPGGLGGAAQDGRPGGVIGQRLVLGELEGPRPELTEVAPDRRLGRGGG